MTGMSECAIIEGTLAIHHLLWAISIGRRRYRPGRRRGVFPGQAGHLLLRVLLLLRGPVTTTRITVMVLMITIVILTTTTTPKTTAATTTMLFCFQLMTGQVRRARYVHARLAFPGSSFLNIPVRSVDTASSITTNQRNIIVTFDLGSVNKASQR